jgi:hypothetical protein
MKKIVFIFLVGFSFTSVKAQNQSPDRIKSDNLGQLKKQGKLTGKEWFYNSTGGTKSLILSNQARNNGSNHTMSSSSCNCWIPRDTSFHPVPFDGSGASGGPGVAPLYQNDDWSTRGIILPFKFCLYGDTVGTAADSLYINNNGNISFGSPYSIFSPVPFPTSTYTMIAPFWGDVATVLPSSTTITGFTTSGGVVYYQLTPTHLIVQWDSVGVYNHAGQINTFQLIITDGIDSILPAGNNISFCYGEMQWTTGDASGGVNGFGGTSSGASPATVGINKGDGINYFQVSLFDTAGSAYTGPIGNPPSGVNWLTGKSIFFNSCGTSANLPPIALGDSSVCDTLNLYAIGDSLVQRISCIAPESNQSNTITATAATLGSSFSVENSTSGVNASLTFKVVNSGLAVGYYNVTVIAKDNGTPPLTTTLNYVIHVFTAGTTGIKQVTGINNQVNIYPNPNNGNFVVESNNTAKQTMQVYDINGKVVLSQVINGKTTIDAGNLSEGVYNISIISNEGVVNKRLVIVR